MKRIVDVRFTVRKSLERAWAHLAELEKWPSWARHIRSVEKSPPGPLSAATAGTIVLANGMTSTFRMTEFVDVDDSEARRFALRYVRRGTLTRYCTPGVAGRMSR